jgi:hypothetical protein
VRFFQIVQVVSEIRQFFDLNTNTTIIVLLMMEINSNFSVSLENPEESFEEYNEGEENEDNNETQQSAIVLENAFLKPKRRVFSLTEKKRIVEEANKSSAVFAGSNNYVDPRNVRRWQRTKSDTQPFCQKVPVFWGW